MGSVIDLKNADRETLLSHMTRGGEVGSALYEAAKDMLQLRNLEAQTEATKLQTDATKDLVKETKSLGKVTVILLWVTFALAVETTILLFKE